MVSTWDAPVQNELRMVEEQLRESVHSEQPLLTEISNYIISSGGKRMRPAVTILIFKATGGIDSAKVIKVASAFELIHSATLLHDDINDHGEMRRGRMAAYKKYGTQKALIAGDFLFVKSFALGGVFPEKVISVVADACTGIAESEILQSDYERNQDTNVDVYIKIIEGKTARPFEAGARVGSYLAEASPAVMDAMGSYGLNIGIAFQIVDDILDFTGEQSTVGKPVGSDLLNGLVTLPAIYYAEACPEDEDVKSLADGGWGNQDHMQRLVESIRKTDAVKKAMGEAKGHAGRALQILTDFDPSPEREGLENLVKYIVDRNV